VAEESDMTARRNERDHGLRRLKAITALLGVAMVVLAGAVAALAAATASGRKLVRILPRRETVTAAHHRSHPAIPPPPALASTDSGSTPANPGPAQAPAPTPTPAPPVAVSGGS